MTSEGKKYWDIRTSVEQSRRITKNEIWILNLNFTPWKPETTAKDTASVISVPKVCCGILQSTSHNDFIFSLVLYFFCINTRINFIMIQLKLLKHLMWLKVRWAKKNSGFFGFARSARQGIVIIRRRICCWFNYRAHIAAVKFVTDA